MMFHPMPYYLFILLGAIVQQTLTFADQSHCRCLSNDPTCWPSLTVWQNFNVSVNGRLLRPITSAAPCTADRYDAKLCSDTLTNWADSTWRSDQVGAMQYFNWENSSCSIWNINSSCTQGSIPTYAVNATWPEHIQTTIKFAATHNLRLMMKTTGHDLLGRSTSFGSLLLWLHHMKNMTLIPQYKLCNGSVIVNAVRLTAGVQWGDVYTWLNNYNLTVLGGTSKSVAAAGGFIQGGGHSPLGRWGGMPTDQVLAYDVVLANGQRHTVTPCKFGDLFRALSGGGAGTYAVVVSVILKTFPSPAIIASEQVLQASSKHRYKRLIRDFFRWLPSLADMGWSGYFVMKDLSISISMAWPNGNISAARTVFTEFASKNPDLEYLSSQIVQFSSLYEFYANVLNGRDPTGYSGIVGSRLLPQNRVLKRIDDLARIFVQIRGESASLSALTISLVSGGAAAIPSGFKNSINPAWRSTMLHVFYGQAWSDEASINYQNQVATRVKDQIHKLDRLFENTFLRCYMNEADPNEPLWRQRFFGSLKIYNDLKRIKRKYDPSSLFICKNCVGSDKWTKDLNCRKN